jgi:hypothetical protein
MATSERPIDRAKRAGRRMIREVGSELRTARVTSGLSQEDAGAPCDMSHSEVHRLESGGLKRIDPVKMCCYAEVVGLVPALRFFPDGDAIRDAGHAAVLERFRRILHPALAWRTEVPLPLPGDRRAWDAMIAGQGWSCPIEAETRLGDGQALARRIALKQRDGGADHVLIVASDTRHNRIAADPIRRAFGPAFATALRTSVGSWRQVEIQVRAGSFSSDREQCRTTATPSDDRAIGPARGRGDRRFGRLVRRTGASTAGSSHQRSIRPEREQPRKRQS